MNRRQRKLISIAGSDRSIQITDDGSRTLIFPSSAVAYHSASGARTETESVYLANSGIRQLLQEASRDDRQGPVHVLEIGLGTGLAMLMTLQVAVQNDSSICYTAVERELLDMDVLRNLDLETQIGDPALVDAYFAWHAGQPRSQRPETLHWKVGERQLVEIAHMDALDWVQHSKPQQSFDAIYFDPFAPDVNPELWTESFLQQMRDRLEPTGRLVTYCVSRSVRESMHAAGFDVQRVQGPVGGKREVLIARPMG